MIITLNVDSKQGLALRIETTLRGEDICNAMPPGGQGLNKQDPAVIRLMNQQKQMILSMGQSLHEEVMHMMRHSVLRLLRRYRRDASPAMWKTQSSIKFWT